MGIFKDKGINFRYRIVSAGPLLSNLQKLRDRLGLQDVVEFLGEQPSEFVAQELAKADLFLLPSVTGSLGDMEGIPVALMEAHGHGHSCGFHLP